MPVHGCWPRAGCGLSFFILDPRGVELIFFHGDELIFYIISFLENFYKVFPIFSCFLELRRLRDHSQIVDLAERIRMVSLRAPETSKISKWCQNNVPKPFPASSGAGGGDSIFYLIFFALEVQGSQKKRKYRLVDSGCGGVPAPFFFWRPP